MFQNKPRNATLILASAILSIMVSGVEVAEAAKITVTMVGDSVYNFDKTNRLVRASVDVVNYSPSDGQFYMQIIQPNTGKIIKESEIIMTERDNDLWGAQIASIVDDEAVIQNGKVVQGDYKLKVFTTQSSTTASTTFSIIKPSEQVKTSTVEEGPPEEEEPPKEESPLNNPEQQEQEETEQDDNIELGEVPEWVKNIALWYGQGLVSEKEFLDAIRYLIYEGIIEV